MSKWKREVDFGNVAYYVCPCCGYGEDDRNAWQSPYCPECGTRLEDDEKDNGTELVEDVPLICVDFDCKHNYEGGLCRMAEFVKPTELFCKYKEYAKPNPEDFYRSIERAK